MAISAKELPLGKVFTPDFRFTIPSFQRAYIWKTENILQLVSDLDDACKSPGTPYFLGSLILVREGDNRYDVIDGQQRLVSLSIIIAVLRDLERDPDLMRQLDALLVEPGEGVAVENPGYRAAAYAFAIAGANVQGVAVDQDGMDCSALAHLNNCRLAYVTPSHQYPSGVTLSLARRLELLAWAERTQGWIVEDDYDGEYRYSGAPLAPLAALDRSGRVIYVGTFGKVAFPALRLGYLVLPKGLTEPFARRRSLDMRHSEVSTQAVMAEFMAAGHFQRHIRRMRRAALSRRDVLLANWPRDVAGVGAMPAIAAGLHVAVPVAGLAREQELLAQARAVEVEINGLSSYWQQDSVEPVDNRAGLVLGFAAVPEVEIKAALERLGKVWNGGH